MKFGIVVVAAVIALLLAGTLLTPIQSYARSNNSKPGSDGDTTNDGSFFDSRSLKQATNDERYADLKNNNQSINQQNLCYRDNTCRQSNVGQNTLGNDNQVTGFADQSDNLQQSAPATGSAGLLISVYKVVTCPQGLVCPTSGFIIHVTGNNPNPNNFTLRDGQSKQVPIGPGHYLVTEDEPPTPPKTS
jgi:hypothetical protein